jgi:hypothetical protein
MAIQEQYWRTKLEEVQYQKQLWTNQKITKYKLEVRELTYNQNYTRTIIVGSDTVVENAARECCFIEELFSSIETVIEQKRCGNNGCECDGPIVTDVVYDETYHFPKTGKLMNHPEEGWKFGPRPTFCTFLGDLSIGTSWEIYSFTSLE